MILYNLPIIYLFFRNRQVLPGIFYNQVWQHIYMIFLLYFCRSTSAAVHLNDEFESYAWVAAPSLKAYDLNLETIKTFTRLGLI